ncbi:aminotransferase [Alicyclobacillus cellulosilyticus]|uniref:Aminotransferase n=1 Tax=Alicyclobacillus cellulosilyticus TaxID=1003997 RepID=A0A917NID4_9BACL|nr:pyridoxal phosphate-dependent aminotransferase [Alicyclobacillus cellulosilyticus]GGJ02733.1 aminotransferase [Alicyclobacillus cellulosilyticus]
MEHHISQRVRAITPSATVAMDTKTKALIQQGKPVINMSVGEPDFQPPEAASLAGIKAIVTGLTKYTAVAGMMELRKAIARKLQVENGLAYTPEQIIVSSGAKQSLYNIFLTICEPGDEVILPAPYWVSYPEQIRLAGAVPVIIPTDESSGFKVTPEQLRQAITSKTRAFLLNSPSNPTGAVYNEEELRAIGQVLRDHDLYIVTDEIYEKLVYGVAHVSLPAVCPDLMERTLVVNGFSKAFAMTGYRLGYVAGPREIIQAMTSLQSHSSHSPSTITQVAGIAALDAFNPAVVAEFRRRRDALIAGLREIPGIACTVPEGAFYAFPNVARLFGKAYEGVVIDSAAKFSELLLEHELVATVPGESFGAPNNVRLSYATAYEDVVAAVERIQRFVRALR